MSLTQRENLETEARLSDSQTASQIAPKGQIPL